MVFMFFCGLVADIYYETHETSIGAMPTRERGETFVYTINHIIIIHLNHSIFAPSTRRN